MRAVVVGCGRVGSAVAKGLAADGWDVTVVDEAGDALSRLGPPGEAGFVVGHGMDVTVLERAGVRRRGRSGRRDGRRQHEHRHRAGAPAALRRRDRRRSHPRPRARELVRGRGISIVCPTQTAISGGSSRPFARRGPRARPDVRGRRRRREGRLERDRSLLELGHEVTMIEQRPDRFARLEEEFGPGRDPWRRHRDRRARARGDRPSAGALLAVTGDDEDNLVISQIAKETYGVRRRSRA